LIELDFLKAESNYCLTPRELLHIVRTLEYFHRNLLTDDGRLCVNLVPEFYEPRRTNRTLNSALAGVGTSLLSSTVKAGSTTMSMPFHDDPAKKAVPTSTKSRHGKT
jgi:hypothetical protein